MQRQLIILLLVHLLLPCTGCTFTEIPDEELNRMCEAEAGPHGQAPIPVDGYYFPGRHLLTTLDSLTAMLTVDRFQFIEIDTTTLGPVLIGDMKHAKQANMEERFKAPYVRVSVAKKGDPRCKVYERVLELNTREELVIASDRIQGLYPKGCIAVEYTDTLLSEYGVFERAERDPRYPNSAWIIFEIRHLATDRVKTDFRVFKYCRQGGLTDKNGCRGGSKNLFYCPPPAQISSLNRYTFINKALVATPNPLLEAKLIDKVINDPIPQPIPEVRPELLQVIEGEENIESINGERLRDLTHPRDPNGLAWTSKHRIRYTLNGVKYRAEQPHLCIIDERERKLLKVDINIGKERKRWGYFFSSMRAIPGDAIYLIARGKGRQERYEPAENFYILAYSWDGSLKRVTKGILPFEFLRKGDPHHYYGNLSIHKDHYRFSILEEEGKFFADSRMQAAKEYRFKLSFK